MIKLLIVDDDEIMLEGVLWNIPWQEQSFREKSDLSIQLLVNKFLCDLLMGIGSEELVEKEARLLDIRFLGKLFCVAVINIDNSDMFYNTKDNHNTDLLVYSIQNICSELFLNYNNGAYCVVGNGRVSLLLNFLESETSLEQKTLDILSDIKKNIENYLKIKISIGVGRFNIGYKGIPNSYDQALMTIEMRELMGKNGIIFSENIANNEGSHQMLMKRIVDYVNKNYLKSDLSLSDIASEVHISATYISTLFKKYMEINFSDYLTDIRIKKAMELFQNTDLKSYEVAEKVGYSNPQYFGVLFKKITGFTTTEYKFIHPPN